MGASFKMIISVQVLHKAGNNFHRTTIPENLLKYPSKWGGQNF